MKGNTVFINFTMNCKFETTLLKSYSIGQESLWLSIFSMHLVSGCYILFKSASLPVMVVVMEHFEKKNTLIQSERLLKLSYNGSNDN